MAWQLTREVLDHAPVELTPAERLVLVAVAEFARTPARTWTGPQAEVARRAGLSPDGTRRVLGKLAARGLHVRVALTTDCHGHPVYAIPGRSPTFVVPLLAPADCPCESCRPGSEGGTSGTPKAGPAAHLGGTSGTPSELQGGTRVPAGGTSGTPRWDESPGSPAQSAHPLRSVVPVSVAAAAAPESEPSTEHERAVADVVRRLDVSTDAATLAVVHLLAGRRNPVHSVRALVRSIPDDELREHLVDGQRTADDDAAAALDDAGRVELEHTEDQAAVAHACPICDAEPGAWCRDIGQPWREMTNLHNPRRRLAGHVRDRVS